MARRQRALLVLGAVVLGLVWAAPAGAGQVSAGVVMPEVSAPASTYAGLAAAGVKVVRTFLTMPDVEPSRDAWNAGWLSAYDQWVSHVVGIGARPVIDVVEAAQWASGSSDSRALPSDPRAFAAFAKSYAGFVAALASRYAGRVAAWEIWNEEDESAWWTGGGDPARYAELLKAVYPAVKAADPAAGVVLGGLTGNDYRFMQGVYANGGGGSFDAVGVHTDTACNVLSPYRYLRDANGMINRYSFLGYRSVHAVMAAHGDGAKPIWMTELGWSTAGGICSSGMWAGQKPAGVSEADQATFLGQALHCLSLDSSIVPVASVYALGDGPFTRSYGLQRADGSQKPAFGALQSFLAGGDSLGGGCGWFSGPTISVATPLNGGRWTGQLPITVAASLSDGARAASGDPSLGVNRISLSYDGSHHIRNFTDRSDPAVLVGHMVWDGAKRLSVGRHTLTFVATDSEGNTSSATVTVVHAGGTRSSRSKRVSAHRHRTKHHTAKRHRKKKKKG